MHATMEVEAVFPAMRDERACGWRLAIREVRALERERLEESGAIDFVKRLALDLFEDHPEEDVARIGVVMLAPRRVDWRELLRVRKDLLRVPQLRRRAIPRLDEDVLFVARIADERSIVPVV